MSTPNSNAGHSAVPCMTNNKPDEREFEIDVELVPPAELKPAEAKAATDEDDEVQLAELVKPASEVELNDTARFAESAKPTRVDLPEPLPHEPPIAGGLDWLSDVEPAIKASTLRLKAIPDWIADVAEIEASLSSSGGRPIASKDWLADIGRLENLHTATPPQTNVDPVSAVQTPAANPATTPPSVPVTPTGAGKTAPCEPSEGHPVARDGGPNSRLPNTGCDPTTGEILEAQKYEKWNRQRVADGSAPSQAITTVPIAEAFCLARNALAKWVDDDGRRNLILTADFEDLKKHAEIKAILAEFRSYGPLMRDKLLNHLEFLAKNRRKYYAACSK
jgi:hypothetical protein